MQLLIETYMDNYFQLQIVDISTGTPVISQITAGEYSSYDGVWSPDGKNIAYISDQSGTPSLWTISTTDNQREYSALPVDETDDPSNPVFSPDGTKLAWSAMLDGFRSIFVWDRTQPNQSPRVIGQGDQIAWSPDNQVIFCMLEQPLTTYLTAYSLVNNTLVLPPFILPGSVSGIAWQPSNSDWQQNSWVQEKQSVVDPPLYQVQLTPVVDPGRYNIVQIPGLNLEYPYLHDMVDESFQALRNRLVSETGWDFLANIQSAFLPISQVAAPDQVQDWLYTGRGISINPVPMNVGWMYLVKEVYGSETYWRVYIRPLYQDGSMGAPIHKRAWDMNSRFNNDPVAYEQGGKLAASAIPGYWVDFTDIAHRYDWVRLNALSNWVDYYPAARFNLFINNNGLSWKEAMLQLYPQDIFETPTLITPPTATSTSTPKPRRAVTPSSTPLPTITPTLRPTWTPLP
jgi:TolB protein